MQSLKHLDLRTGACVFALAALLGLSPLAAGAQDGIPLKYRIEAIDLSDYDRFFIGGINNQGEVVGTAIHANSIFDREGFLFRNGATQGMGHLFSTLDGINDRGDLIGQARDPDGNVIGGALYRDGAFVKFDPDAPGPVASGPVRGLNQKGQVVGDDAGRVYFFDGTRTRYLDMLPDVIASRSFGLNDHGVVVGTFNIYDNMGEIDRPFMHDGRQMTVLPTLGTPFGRAFDINNSGQIVGVMQRADFSEAAFLYSGDTLMDLGSGAGLDVNEHGWVVGEGAFLYRDGVRHALADLLVPDAMAHWRLEETSAINDVGQIAGVGELDGVQRAFLATPVPEPATWVVMLAGVGLVGFTARRRQLPSGALGHVAKLR